MRRASNRLRVDLQGNARRQEGQDTRQPQVRSLRGGSARCAAFNCLRLALITCSSAPLPGKHGGGLGLAVVAVGLQRRSHLEQITELQEEAVLRALQTGPTQLARVAQGTAVSGKEHGAGIRLVGE